MRERGLCACACRLFAYLLGVGEAVGVELGAALAVRKLVLLLGLGRVAAWREESGRVRERIKRRRGENDAQLGRVRVVPLGELALLALALLLEGLPARVVGDGAGKTAVGWRH